MRSKTIDLGLEVFDAGAPVSPQDLVDRGYYQERNAASGLLWRLVNMGHWHKCGSYYPSKSPGGDELQVMIVTKDEAQLIKDMRQGGGSLHTPSSRPWVKRGWATVIELTHECEASPRIIDRWIREGRLGGDVEKHGGVWRIPHKAAVELIEWLEQNPNSPPPCNVL